MIVGKITVYGNDIDDVIETLKNIVGELEETGEAQFIRCASVSIEEQEGSAYDDE